MWMCHIEQQNDGNFLMGDIREMEDNPNIKHLNEEIVTAIKKPSEKVMFYVCKNFNVLNAFMMGVRESFTIFNSKDFLQR